MAENDLFTTDLSTPSGELPRVLESQRMTLAPVPTPATVPPQNLEAEEAWAGGLFEGEGAFGIRRNGTVLLSLASTDRDVVERFRTVIGAGRLSSQPPGRNGRRKRLWRVDVIQVDEVLRIIRRLYPWLGTRRRQRAEEAVAILNLRIAIATVARTCPLCGQVFRPPFTPNAARTRFCSRLCERRWHQRRRKVGQVGRDK
jgi:hypothetical protein